MCNIQIRVGTHNSPGNWELSIVVGSILDLGTLDFCLLIVERRVRDGGMFILRVLLS